MTNDESRDRAKAISQYLLDRTGSAMMTGDFDDFKECFRLPQEMDTFDGKRRVETEGDLRDIFDAVTAHYRRLGVDQLVRNCVEAGFKNSDTIEATHQSRLLAGDRLIDGPFPVFSILRREGTKWQVAYSAYAIVSSLEHRRALVGTIAGDPGSDSQM